MNKFLCVPFLLLLVLVGSVSAYNINLNCSPLTIPVGQTIKCSVDSDFPAGTSFNLNFYQKKYHGDTDLQQGHDHPAKPAYPVCAL